MVDKEENRCCVRENSENNDKDKKRCREKDEKSEVDLSHMYKISGYKIRRKCVPYVCGECVANIASITIHVHQCQKQYNAHRHVILHRSTKAHKQT